MPRKFFPLSEVPIKTRLALTFAGLSVGLLLASSAIVYFVFRYYLVQDATDLVRIQYETIQADLDFVEDTSSGLDLAERTLSRIDTATNLGLLVFVYDGSGQAIVSPSPLGFPDGATGAFEESDENGRFFVYGGTFPQASLYVALSEDASVYDKLRVLLRILVAISCVSIAAGFFAGYVFSRQALRPLDRLKAKIAGESHEETHFAADEIGFIAEEFDRYRDRVEDALRREREFSADASHELRTPLTVLRTTIELLEPKLRDANAKKKAAAMLECVDGMEDLVGRLLLLERGLVDGEEEPVDPAVFFPPFVEAFRPLAQQGGIELKFEASGTVPIRSNPERFEHVFGNLLRNAIRHTPSGEVTVRAFADRVEVADTGRGIPPDELEHIWNRFYRGEKSRAGEGAGLGLSIVKRLSDEAGWTVSALSKVGKGTTFTVRFSSSTK